MHEQLSWPIDMPLNRYLNTLVDLNETMHETTMRHMVHEWNTTTTRYVIAKYAFMGPNLHDAGLK